jgi:hypothetical protein
VAPGKERYQEEQHSQSFSIRSLWDAFVQKLHGQVEFFKNVSLGVIQVREEFPFGSSMALLSLTKRMLANSPLDYGMLLLPAEIAESYISGWQESRNQALKYELLIEMI